MRSPLIFTALIVLSFAAPSLRAMYLGSLDNVPVDRLVANLTRLTQKEPGNVTYHVNLARTHAMAYASGATTVRVLRGYEDEGPWYAQLSDPPTPRMPFVQSASASQAAREHLAAALASFAAALVIDPEQSIARLGHAWCLQESGIRDKAIAEYRALIAAIRPQTQARSTLFPPGGFLIAQEAEGYLIRLLGPGDADEIARLKADIETISKGPRVVSPIVIPLRDGLTPAALLDDTTRVHFDADGTALDREWTWISSDAAWLVYDPHQTAQITSALQLFGNVTFLLFWQNGYQALSALDDNGDGTLRGDELDGLALWHDVNHNGVSDPDEVRPLSEWNIVALSSEHQMDEENATYIASSSAGVTFADGSTRPTYDVLLRSR